MRIKELPRAERPREKMLTAGAAALSNAELLALLISSGTREDSALALASKVLAAGEGNLRGLSNFQPQELTKKRGIGKSAACRIIAALEIGRRAASQPPEKRIKLRDAKIVADIFMEEMRHLQQEKLKVIMVNSKGEMMGREDVAIGGIYSACASPREIFMNAVRKGAHGIIIAHNHPSGDPSPSQEDVKITKQIFAAGMVLEIELLDHIIIGDGSFVSLKTMGII